MSKLITIRLLLIAAFLGYCPVAHALTCSDPNLGYTFTVPDDWVQIPAADVADMYHRLTNGAASTPFTYAAAYEPGSNLRHFQYPYLLVQVTPYAAGRSIESISEPELKLMVQSMSGLSADSLHAAFSTEANNALSSWQPGTATYFTAPPGFQFNFQLTVASIGNVRGMMLAHFAKQRLVSVNMYAQEDQWDHYRPTFQGTMDSFTLTPAQQVALGGGTWIQTVATGVGGGIGGGAILAAVFMIKRAMRKKPTPLP